MKTFQEYMEANRPVAGPMVDRSLEGFRTLLDDLVMQTKSVFNQEAKQELFPVVNKFYSDMRAILKKYHSQGIGYHPEYATRLQQMNNPQSNA